CSARRRTTRRGIPCMDRGGLAQQRSLLDENRVRLRWIRRGVEERVRLVRLDRLPHLTDAVITEARCSRARFEARTRFGKKSCGAGVERHGTNPHVLSIEPTLESA